MKKYVAKNADTQDKVFCKYEITKQGILVVEYYLPKAGFSIVWDEGHNFCKISSLRRTIDNRKCVATFSIHPNYWTGFGFSGCHYTSDIFSAMDECLRNNINLHI